jgi:hypothetical protein
MSATLHTVRPQIQTALQCSACGAAGTGSCDCGAPYVAKKDRAAAAISKNPEKSDRAIAAELGMSHQTVMRAREATGPDGPVDQPRVGLDGKVRKPPKPQNPRRKTPATRRRDLSARCCLTWIPIRQIRRN